MKSEQRRLQNGGVRLSIKLIKKKQIQTAFIDHFLHASPLARNSLLVCSCNILTSRKACPHFIEDKSSSEKLSNLLQDTQQKDSRAGTQPCHANSVALPTLAPVTTQVDRLELL